MYVYCDLYFTAVYVPINALKLSFVTMSAVSTLLESGPTYQLWSHATALILPSFCRNALHSSLLLQAAKLCDSAADGQTRQEVTLFMSYLSHDGGSNDWSNPKLFHEAHNPVDTSMLCCCLIYSSTLIRE